MNFSAERKRTTGIKLFAQIEIRKIKNSILASSSMILGVFTEVF